MIWGAFSYHGKATLAFVSPRTNSNGYQTILQNSLLPYLVKNNYYDFTFQQDNASIHVSRGTMKEGIGTLTWLESQHIPFLNWPARSPDLNPIENLWGIMVRAVYANGCQFETVNDLRAAILKAWEEIPPETLHKLVDSMHSRMLDG